MDLGLTGKRAAVAASSAGLGYASAAALAAEGARVAICGRDKGRIDAAAARARRRTRYRSSWTCPADEGATAFVAAAQEALGGVDILVTNAGGPPPGTSRRRRSTPTPMRSS